MAIGGRQHTVSSFDTENENTECPSQIIQKKHPSYLCTHSGMLLAFTASGLFSMSYVCAKLVTTVHPFEVPLIRFTFALAYVIPLMLYKNVDFCEFRDIQYIWFILSCVSISAGFVCSFIAISMIPVGNVVVLNSIRPITTAFMSCCCLSESVTWLDFVLGFVSILGIAAITKPEFIFGNLLYNESRTSGHYVLGNCTAIAVALFSSLAFVSMRKLGKKVNVLTIIFYSSLCGVVITSIPLYIMNRFSLPSSLIELQYVVVTVLCSLLAQLVFLKSLQNEKATVVAIIRTMDIVFSCILEYICLGHQPDWTDIGGAVLIIISSIGVMIQKIVDGGAYGFPQYTKVPMVQAGEPTKVLPFMVSQHLHSLKRNLSEIGELMGSKAGIQVIGSRECSKERNKSSTYKFSSASRKAKLKLAKAQCDLEL
ncbi:solute carrier family 35 member G1-like [Saccoglossus kowalevskii]|uniref:Solute carrier family 35 member G1-like n=1 Tax=Saccoglossus kowalevskii TaxID=10224 RepID=A0ABM0MJN8_SACKO|nr:PREDICTED: solute carrier family 35 member G1-like [Saccoglossus kowalevskii]